MCSSRTLRSLFELNDAPWRWLVGVQAGIATGVPLALYTLAGQQANGLIAVMGGFTALYCAGLRRVDRVRALPLVAAGFVAASALGVLCAGSTWLTIACLIGVAAIACTIAIGVGLGPPGPMQFVLITGISGHLAAPAALGGAAIDRVLVPALVAVGAVGAYLVVIAPLALPSIRRREGAGSRLRVLFPLVWFDRLTATVAVRVVTGVTIASLVSMPLGVPHAYWVIMTAGAVLQVSHTVRLTTIRAVQRVLGTLLGVAAFGMLAIVSPAGIWLVLVVSVLQFVIEVVVARNYGLALIFITPLALTIATANRANGTLAVVGDRVLDTVLGAVIALAVLGASEWGRRRLLARRAPVDRVASS